MSRQNAASFGMGASRPCRSEAIDLTILPTDVGFLDDMEIDTFECIGPEDEWEGRQQQQYLQRRQRRQELQVSRDQQFAEELQEQEHLLDHCAENRHRAVLESEADTRLAEQLQAEEEASSATPPGPWESRPPRDVPYHWTQLDAAHPATAIQLVSLPLPGQEGSPKLPSTVDPSVWAELVEQGVPPGDAVAFLLACEGDGEAALAKALELQHMWGRAQMLLQSDPGNAQHLEAWSGLAEAQRVLDRFADERMRKCVVKRIERVQNKMLWDRYALRRKELCSKLGFRRENESLLFHGTTKVVLEAVINEGFDIREAKRGSLGTGTYFAQQSSYSAAFCSDGLSQDPQSSLNADELHHLEEQRATGKAGCPAFLPGCHAMLLCRVALGSTTQGSSGLRKPPKGFDSVCRQPDMQRNDIVAVFDNNQSYPEYIVHYEATE